MAKKKCDEVCLLCITEILSFAIKYDKKIRNLGEKKLTETQKVIK